MQELKEKIRSLFLTDEEYREAYTNNFLKDGKAILLFLVYKGIITQKEFDDFVKTAVDISINNELDNATEEQLKGIAEALAENVKLKASFAALSNLSNSSKESNV